MQNDENKCKYDVAFSLCKQDVDFVKKIIAYLNPSLKVFFYEHNQEELISKSGPESFGKIFKEEARIVVIVYRNDWSESFYTEIEKNAIIDRTSGKNGGYDFIMVIPLVTDEIPAWYPSTRIYASPQRFTEEQLAKFIEFKIAEKGGNVRQLTLEETQLYLLNRISERKEVIQMQSSKEALNHIVNEISELKKIIERKIEAITSAGHWNCNKYVGGTIPFQAFFSIDDILLEIKITTPDEVYHRISSTQDYTLYISTYIILGPLKNVYDNNENKKVFQSDSFKFYYSENLRGWSSPQYVKITTEQHRQILFRNLDINRSQNYFRYYNLRNPIKSDILIDLAFQDLFNLATEALNKELM